jgi:hypothetical protein
MSAALEHGLWPGVARCLSKRRTYDQENFCSGVTERAFVTPIVEKSLLSDITVPCFGPVAPTGCALEA